ncbi:MAG: hypothetical protein R3B40_02500 [Polyangiales bacterium]|nr:hypothetical protein [Myxococcales bacterium]MCB9657057.1 hypothetical protein [Sandaracinaceae bacterium]
MRHLTYRRPLATGALCATLALAGLGCDDPIQTGSGGTAPTPRPVATPTPTAPPPADSPDATPEGTPDAGPPTVTYADEAFVEIDVQQRDPFRRFEIEVVEAPTVQSVMSDTPVDQMRVLGIVLGGVGPRAMIADRGGLGHTVRPRQYIGQPEAVQVGGADGIAVPLVWRVDRIRPNEVILTRENPSAPDQPPLTRTLTLRSEDQMMLMSIGGVAPIQGETATPAIPTIPTIPSGG